MTIKEKRIYESYTPNDGYRVLVDRLWPRGISKEKAHLDLWAKQIAPSNELRKAYHEGHYNYSQFKAAYLEELKTNPDTAAFVKTLKEQSVVTLLSGNKELDESQVPVIMEYLKSHT